MHLLALLPDASAWAALVTLSLLFIAPKLDNLIFNAILSPKVPASQQIHAGPQVRFLPMLDIIRSNRRARRKAAEG